MDVLIPKSGMESKFYRDHCVMHRKKIKKIQALELTNLPYIYNTQVVFL